MIALLRYELLCCRWAFPSSNEVNIFCNLRVCMSRFCSFSNCSIDASPDNASSGRQRRHHFNEESSGEVDEIETLEMAKIRLRRELSHEAVSTVKYEGARKKL